ncbi:hypothetical protein WN944_023324 [Citrus x changshan-huyou]|uniref:Uncharacterized protein n=1 Tax=Citrus x changshan-huyou TaxID=2935761 RepID=A0AAP0N053_9ROSI
MEQREPSGSTKKEVEGSGNDKQQVNRKTARANKNRATLRKQLMETYKSPVTKDKKMELETHRGKAELLPCSNAFPLREVLNIT